MLPPTVSVLCLSTYKTYATPLPYFGMWGNKKTSWYGPANKRDSMLCRTVLNKNFSAIIAIPTSSFAKIDIEEKACFNKRQKLNKLGRSGVSSRRITTQEITWSA